MSMDLLLSGLTDQGVRALEYCRTLPVRVAGFVRPEPGPGPSEFAGLPVLDARAAARALALAEDNPEATTGADSDVPPKASAACQALVLTGPERLRDEALYRSLGVPIEKLLVFPGTNHATRGLAARFPDVPLAPPRWEVLQIGLSNRCHLMCSHCVRRPGAPGEFWTLTPAGFTDLLDRFDPRRFGILSLSDFCEPLLVPDLPVHLRAAKERGFATMFSTSGTLLRPLEDIVAQGLLDGLTVSVEAVSEAGYRRMRGRDRGVFFEFLGLLRDLRKRHGPAPRPVFLCTVLAQCLDEYPALPDLAAEFGLEGIIFHHVQPGFADGAAPEDKLCVPSQSLDTLPRERVVEVFGRVRDRARAHGIPVYYPEHYPELGEPFLNRLRTMLPLSPEPLDLARAVRRCPLPGHMVRVTRDGGVHPCCQMPDAFPLGNIREQSLDEIWAGARTRDLLAGLKLGGRLPESCAGCLIPAGKGW